MRMMTLIAMSALSIAAAAPAVAQDAMMKKDEMKSGEMKMSAADTKKMKMCNAMSHDKMMKDAECVKVTMMHPGMMKHDDMTKKPG